MNTTSPIRSDNANTTLYEPPAIEAEQSGPKNEFLRLLVAQMQNQDPLEPQDGSEFVAQLAQFANIELGVETNTRLAALEAGQVSDSRATMMGLVGKTVTADASDIRLTGKGGTDFQVDLDAKANKVDIVVYDENQNEVARIEAGQRAAGEFTVQWDGKGKNGMPLPEGDYHIDVQASSGEQGEIEASISLSGLTTSIEFAQDGSTLLGLGGVLIAPGAIQSVENGV